MKKERGEGGERMSVSILLDWWEKLFWKFFIFLCVYV